MPIRKIGYACMNLSLNEGVKKKDQITTSRTLRMSGFSLDRVGQLAVQNSMDLVKIMEWNRDIYTFPGRFPRTGARSSGRR